MPAYLIVEHVITDAVKFEEYRVKVGPMIARHGGRYLTKGGSHKMPEGGQWKPERVVIKPVPNNVTVAGIPAKVVGEAGCAEPSRTMDQMLYGIMLDG